MSTDSLNIPQNSAVFHSRNILYNELPNHVVHHKRLHLQEKTEKKYDLYKNTGNGFIYIIHIWYMCNIIMCKNKPLVALIVISRD